MSKNKDIEIIKIFIAMQDVKALDKYNVFLVEVRKQISTNKLLVVYLSKGNINLSVTHKEVYEMVKKSKFDMCISSIEELTYKSIHVSLYGYRYEHNMIVQYIENFNSVLIEGIKSQKLSVGQEIFLLDTDSQSNRWKWDIYQIKPTTIAIMLAIRYGLKRRGKALLSAFNLLID